MNPSEKPGKKMPRSQTMGLRWVCLIVMLIAGLMVHTMVRTQATQTILRISKAQAQLSGLRSYNRELTLERDRLRSDARIVRIARNRLGLTTDVFNQTIYLKDDT